MPAPYPPEFRQRAVELARQKERPISQDAKSGWEQTRWSRPTGADPVLHISDGPVGDPGWSACWPSLRQTITATVHIGRRISVHLCWNSKADGSRPATDLGVVGSIGPGPPTPASLTCEGDL